MRLYQNIGMTKEIEEAGCGLLCAIEVARLKLDRFGHSSELCKWVEEVRNRKTKTGKPLIGEGCFINDWDQLFKELGMSVKCRYEKANYVPLESETCIDKWRDTRKREHFTTGDYDPWNPSAKTVRLGWVAERLVIRPVKEMKNAGG